MINTYVHIGTYVYMITMCMYIYYVYYVHIMYVCIINCIFKHDKSSSEVIKLFTIYADDTLDCLLAESHFCSYI